VKQRRTIASIDDLTDENNRPNKRNKTINSWDDDDDGNGDDDDPMILKMMKMMIITMMKWS